MVKDTLSEEVKTYNKNKQNLLKSNAGKFVLIKGDKIIDTYDTYNDAIKAGIDKFENNPFLVKKITEVDEALSFTSDLIKLVKCLQ